MSKHAASPSLRVPDHQDATHIETASRPVVEPIPSLYLRIGRRGLKILISLIPVLLVTVLAFVVRMLMATRDIYTDSDETQTYDMVRQILAGKNFTFYQGQNYSGSIEQYLQAWFYKLTGVAPSLTNLRFVQVVLGTLIVTVTFFVGRRIGGLAVGLIAGTALAVGPYFQVFWSTRSYGAYDSPALFALIAIWCAIHLHAHAHDRYRQDWYKHDWYKHDWGNITVAFILGLMGGLIVWCGWAAGAIGIAAFLWVIPGLYRFWRRIIASIAGALIGVYPVIHWMHETGLMPGMSSSAVPKGTIYTAFHKLVHDILPTWIGTAGYSRGGMAPYALPLHVSYMILAIILVGFIGACLFHGRDMLRVFVFTRTPRHGGAILCLIFPIYFGTYFLSAYAQIPSARYLFALYPYAAIGAALVIATCIKAPLGFVFAHVHIPDVVKTIFSNTILGLVCVAIAVTGWQMTFRAMTAMNKNVYQYTTPAQLQAAVPVLEAKGITRLYGDDWTTGPLNFYSQIIDPSTYSTADPKTLVAASCYGAYAELHPTVDAAPNPAYIEANRPMTQPSWQNLGALLTKAGVKYQTLTLPGQITVYYNLNPVIRPSKLPVINDTHCA